jgi:galactose mutarotase-like enzyme
MLEIQTKKEGAELTSIKYNGVERLHEVNSFWKQQSPILFPIVGKLRYDVALINEKEYPIPKHGFACNMVFEEMGNHSYKLTSNDETLKKYPYQFELYVNYTIEKNILYFNYKVINISENEKMLFGIGGHPGFKCNYTNEKCTVEFEEEENEIKIIPVDIKVCLLDNNYKNGNDVLVDKKILKLKKNSFENDAIIFTDIKSKSLILKDDDKKLLKFNFGQFKYLGIWSSIGADFVCFEPWYNTPDYINSTKDFKEKKDIIELEPGKEFNINFSVEFY